MRQLSYKNFKVITGWFLVLPTLLGLYLGYLQFSGNFHKVIPGELYRSAQPTAAMISYAVKKEGIKTILNLRGANPQRDWYQNEVREIKSLGVNLIEFRMSAKRELTKNDTDKLIDIMRKAPKPLLIHCQGGADRSGLAVAIYLAVLKNIPAEEAESQISIRFGHFSLPYLSKSFAMDTTFEKVEKWYDLLD
ncbi:MAG: fused DSP-PTPase phosphatase/NAD kinase-like protein [Rhodomicrobiaceae bacterium]